MSVTITVDDGITTWEIVSPPEVAEHHRFRAVIKSRKFPTRCECASGSRSGRSPKPLQRAKPCGKPECTGWTQERVDKFVKKLCSVMPGKVTVVVTDDRPAIEDTTEETEE